MSTDRSVTRPATDSRPLRVRTALKAGPNARKHDHLTDHNWQLEIEGVTQG